ncbi:MAG: phage tail protein [Bacillota bacterium]|nr:phage tail protein [Bacillota bacterium]
MNAIVTRYRRKQLAQVTSGLTISIPKVKFIAFGDGGCEGGVVKAPSEVQAALFHEVKRYEITEKTLMNEVSVRYQITIPEADLIGTKINEVALVDETGKICAIQTFQDKVKDEGVKFIFEFDDEY